MTCKESYQAGLQDGELIGMNKIANAIQDKLKEIANKNDPLRYSDIIHCLNEVIG